MIDEDLAEQVMEEIQEVTDKYRKYISEISITWKDKEDD